MIKSINTFDKFQIAEYISDAILVLDKDDLIIKFVNSQAEDIFGTSKNNIIEESLAVFFDESSIIFDYIRSSIIKHGNFVYNDVVLNVKKMHKNNNIYKLEIINNLELNFIILCFRCDNKIIKIKEESNEIFLKIDSIIGKIIGSLKNPISSIKGSMQLICKKNEIDNELKEIIFYECEKIFKLVKVFESKLVDIFEKKESFNVHKILRNVSQFLKKKHSKKIEFFESFDPSLPNIKVNRLNLTEAFRLILSSSIEAIGNERGYIKISTKFIYGSTRRVPNIRNKNYKNFLNISIEDNRQGINQDEIKNIFLPFFSSKGKNQGLDLYIAKKIIYNHDGDIEVFYHDKITRIIVNLPIL